MSNKNKSVASMNREYKKKQFKDNKNALIEAKYTSIYFLVAFFEQLIVLELLGDLCSKQLFVKLGFLSLVIMLILLHFLTKRVKDIVDRKESFPQKYDYTDKLSECAISLSYASPIMCIATYVGKI